MRLDFLQYSSGGFPRFERGELTAKVNDGQSGGGSANALPCRGRHAWAKDQQIKLRDAQQHECVTKMATGLHVIFGSEQQFTQIRKNVPGAVDAEDAGTLSSRLFDASVGTVKGCHCLFFGVVDVEQLCQVRDLQNLSHVLGQVAQFEVPMSLTKAVHAADNRA